MAPIQLSDGERMTWALMRNLTSVIRDNITYYEINERNYPSFPARQSRKRHLEVPHELKPFYHQTGLIEPLFMAAVRPQKPAPTMTTRSGVFD